eukprot:8108251-Alexandrium_andersonii.AAC.1
MGAYNTQHASSIVDASHTKHDFRSELLPANTALLTYLVPASHACKAKCLDRQLPLPPHDPTSHPARQT